MNIDREVTLMPGYNRFHKSEITGPRARNVITFNPNSANEGEVIYVHIPKLKPGSTLVPDKMYLLFDFKNKNTKSWFNNNLAKQLQERLEVRFAGEKVYDNSGESLLETYEDLWLDQHSRNNMIEDGIATENQRKIISKSDDANADAYASVYKTKQRIQLGKILRDHGLYAPHSMANDLQFIITLPKGSTIMTAQTNQVVAGYSLENIELEYETINNVSLVKEIESTYQVGRALTFEHVTLMKTSPWGSATTLINETINLPRRSMKAVVMLFTKATRDGSEEFVFPNIDLVKITIEGVPNSIYSQGIPKRRLYEEAERLFRKHDTSPIVTAENFFTENKFALVVDLRSINDNDVYGDGTKLLTTQSGIMMEIQKKATTTDLKCHIFILSDGVLKVQAGAFQSVSY